MVSSRWVSWGERLFFNPNGFDWVVIFLLSPFSLLFGTVMLVRRMVARPKSYPLPILSIGNLTVGGSGKTPFVIATASRYTNVMIVSRGYGRMSKGLVEVSRRGKILVDVGASGDEPMLMAQRLPYASVVVSEDRHQAIEFAIAQGYGLIILDDGFNRVDIKKFEVLLCPKSIRNYFPFPAGPFREFLFMKYWSDLVVREGEAFHRRVEIVDSTSKMFLVTAISNPKRLEAFLPKEKIVGSVYLEDHAYFSQSQLKAYLRDSGATSLLVTEKDRVKMENFNLPLSVMVLHLEIKEEILQMIDNYCLVDR